MQLGEPNRRPTSIRAKLGAAACALLASSAPARAADVQPANQLDAANLLYGEAQRVTVVEPTARFSHLFDDGQSLYGDLTLDAITGASPSGAVPTGRVQTITTASGRVVTRAADQIPTNSFSDTRFAVGAGWVRPFWLLTPTLELRFSTEKDYQSLGGSGKVAFDLPDKLTTLTAGGGYDEDTVSPQGGITEGLADPAADSTRIASNKPKHVASGLFGVSRVLTRRWLVGLTGTYTSESGYLTEPYKLLSVVDPVTGLPVSEVTEKRPSSRTRTSVLASSAYDFDQDVLYLSYRYYWDDWHIDSHTVDLKYRYAIGGIFTYLEPHLRYYDQTAADFFRFGLIEGEPLPDFATSDYRLGPLTSITAGATVGVHIPSLKGDWTVRAEYIGQFGDGHPSDAVGVQRQYDLYPAMNIGTLVIGYELKF